MFEERCERTTHAKERERRRRDRGRAVLGGLALVAAMAVLYWNEGRAVRRLRGVSEGADAVVPVSSARVEAANAGKLVHLSGRAGTSEVLVDPELGVKVNALRLVRRVELYQWQERRETRTVRRYGGGEDRTTVWTYRKVWADHPLDSTWYRESIAHRNPVRPELESASWESATVKLGAFAVPPGLIRKLPAEEPLLPTQEMMAGLREPFRSRARIHGRELYVGGSPLLPRVGDLRISFAVQRPGDLSVVARQVGDTFQMYPVAGGRGDLALIQPGSVSPQAMFRQAVTVDTRVTWVLRGFGFLVMALGLGGILAPLRARAEMIPLGGDLLGIGVALGAVVLALALALFTIAAAWLLHRPLLGAALGAAGVLVLLLLRRRRRRE